MSRVDWDPYRPGEARDVSRLNTALQDLATQSGSLGTVNFAQEGLTRAELAHRPRQRLFGLTDSTRDATGLTATSWATFSQNGVAQEYTTNFTLFEQKLLVKWRVHLTSRNSSRGIGSSSSPVEFRIAVKKTTAAETTHCYRKLGRVLSANGWASGVWLIDSDGTYDYVRLEYQIAGGTIRPGFSHFYGILLNRTS